MKDVTDDKLKQNIVVTDAKALYDALDRQCLEAKEKQVALVTAEIKQVMAIAGLTPRWIPHNVMVVDGLTKEQPQTLAATHEERKAQVDSRGRRGGRKKTTPRRRRTSAKEQGRQPQSSGEHMSPPAPRYSCECRKQAFGRL